MSRASAVSAVFRSYPQFPKQTADFRRSCFPPVRGGTTAEVCGWVCGRFRNPQFNPQLEVKHDQGH
jgi:hypothetical protein